MRRPEPPRRGMLPGHVTHCVPCCALRRDGRESLSQGGNRYAEIPDVRKMPASTRLARCSAGWIVAVAADERGRYGAARNTIGPHSIRQSQHSVDRHHRHRRADPVSVGRARSANRGGDSRRELGNHQHFPDDHGAITAVPDRNRASFPARHARRFEPRFLSSAHARVPGQRSLQGPFFKLLEQNGKAVGQLTLHRRILVLQSLSNT